MLKEVLWGVFYACPWHGVAGPHSLPGVMIFSGSCQATLPSHTLLAHPSHPAYVWNSIDLLFHLTVNGHRPTSPIANPARALIPLYLICPAESSAFITYPNTHSSPTVSDIFFYLWSCLFVGEMAGENAFSPFFFSFFPSCSWLLCWLVFICACSASFKHSTFLRSLRGLFFPDFAKVLR